MYDSPLAVVMLHIDTKTGPNPNPNPNVNPNCAIINEISTMWCTFEVDLDKCTFG